MEPNRLDARLNSMSTESISGFLADPAAVSDLGSTYQRSGAALSAQATRFAEASAMVHGDAFGPVGAVFTAALSDAAQSQAARARQVSALLTDAHHTAMSSAASFIEADTQVATNLGGFR